MKPACLVAALFLGVPLAAGPIAHGQDRQATPQNPPTFRSGVELVRMDVRFLDDNGRLVTDLKAEELEVVEGGKMRPVVLFQRVSEPSGTYLDVARRTSPVNGICGPGPGSPYNATRSPGRTRERRKRSAASRPRCSLPGVMWF
jgi:hypothetical protein